MLWTSSIEYIHFQVGNFFQWCCAVFISITQLCWIKPELRFCALPMGTNFWLGLKVFNLFRLLENETLEMFSIRERRKSKYESGGTKFFKAEEVRKYFVNSKIENDVFGSCVNYIILNFSLGFRNISWTLSLFIANENKEWCHFVEFIDSPAHFIAHASFLSIFSYFFCVYFTTCLDTVVSFSMLKIKQCSCS